jgi:hypothetical protein
LLPGYGEAQVLAGLMASAITFKKCTIEKMTFIILNLLDLGLTIFALSQGAHELNPLMRSMMTSPAQMYIAKMILPLFLAWLLPGKLLLPSIALLLFVVGWDVHQLIIFYM